MQQAAREKIAVALFVVILGLTAVGLCAYLVLGHHWNNAATTIDDYAGDMKGYTTILFEGTAAPDYADVDAPDAPQRSGVPLSLVEQEYRDKKSSVLVLDSVDGDYYRSPRVVSRNGTRFGIIGFASDQSPASIRAAVKALRKKADCIIAVVPYSKLVSDVDGIDIICDLQTMAAPKKTAAQKKAAAEKEASDSSDSGFFGDGKAYNASNCAVGSVMAIIISPSKNVSTRVVDSL